MSKPEMCVGFLGETLSARGGGIASAMQSSVDALLRRGCAVEVFGVKDGTLGSEILPYREDRLHLVKAWNTPGLRWAPALDHELAKRDLDVLHQHGLWQYPSIAASRWGRATGRPVVISPHGMLDHWALNNSGWKKRIARVLFENSNLGGAACLHALNHEELRSLRDLGLRNAVAVIPNGVELPIDGLSHARPDFMSADARKILLFLGRIHPKKGLTETLVAWERALALNPELKKDWVLVIAGWGECGYVEQLQRQARELGLEEVVRFPGPAFGTDKTRLFAHANAFILASYSEGLPLAVLEAWAHRVPVLMSRSCNLPEGFQEGAALEITVHPDALATSLINALNDQTIPKLGEEGRKLVERRYCWDGVGRGLLAVYHWLLGHVSKPDFVVVD